MIILVMSIYLWAGTTCAFHLWQMEVVAETLNGVTSKPIRTPLHESPIRIVVLALIWPILLPWQVFISARDHDEIFKPLICLIRGHDREYWSIEKVDKEGVMGGVFTPYRCRRCGHESQAMKPPSPV